MAKIKLARMGYIDRLALRRIQKIGELPLLCGMCLTVVGRDPGRINAQGPFATHAADRHNAMQSEGHHGKYKLPNIPATAGTDYEQVQCIQRVERLDGPFPHTLPERDKLPAFGRCDFGHAKANVGTIQRKSVRAIFGAFGFGLGRRADKPAGCVYLRQRGKQIWVQTAHEWVTVKVTHGRPPK